MKPIRLAMIGCGEFATAVHGPALRGYADAHRDVELAACCNLDPGRGERFRAAFGFTKSFTDVGATLRATSPDALYVVVPVDQTASVVLPLLKLGLPIFMEKPPARSAEELQPLIDAARASGAAVQVGFNRRHLWSIVRAREIIATELHDDVSLEIDYTMIRHNRRDADFSTTAVHAIDTARFLAGTPFQTATMTYRDLPEFGPGVMNFDADIRCESGSRLRLSFRPMAGRIVEQIAIHGVGRSIYVEFPASEAGPALAHWSAGKLVESSSARADDPLGHRAQTAAFFESIRTGRPAGPGLADAIQPVMLMHAIARRASQVDWRKP